MLGLSNDTNPSLGFKASSGSMVWFNSEGGDALNKSETITELAGTGARNVGVDPNGKLIELAEKTEFDWTNYTPQESAPAYLEGRLWFDEFANTMKVHNDKGIDIQMGRTISSRFTAEENIVKGQTLYASNLVSAGVYGVKLAIADSYNENWVVGMAGNDALTGEICEFIQQGFIHGVDTSLLTESVPLYFDVVRGGITNTRPDFPAEPIIIGAVLVKDAVSGVIGVNMNRDTYDHSFDGCIIEKQECNIVVDGTSVYLDVSNLEHAGYDLPIQLSSEIVELDTTTGDGTSPSGSARVELIQGTATAPQDQVVYIDLTASVAELKVTTGYPPVPFCIVSDISIRDYTNVGLYGADAHRRATTAKWSNGRGRESYIAERFAIMAPEYRSGVIPTATLDQGQTPDSMNLSVIAGIVYQTHRQSFPALTVNTNGIFVANGAGGASLDNYSYHTDLTTLTGWTSFDEPRNTLCTGSLVIFGAINKSTSECKLYCNLPSRLQGSNTTAGKTTYDNIENDAVFTSPSELNTVSFLIARIPYRLSSSGNTLTFLDTDGDASTSGEYIISLLGGVMGSAGGGVGGGSVGIQNLAQVLSEGNDAGNVQIKNGADGTDAQDFITLAQLQAFATLNGLSMS